MECIRTYYSDQTINKAASHALCTNVVHANLFTVEEISRWVSRGPW